MNKFLCVILVIFFLITGCSFNNSQEINNKQIMEPKNFVKYFDKSDSKIFKDCNKDSDCKLQFLQSKCPPAESINKNNSKDDITEFTKKQDEIMKHLFINCIRPNIETLKAVCVNKICITKNK